MESPESPETFFSAVIRLFPQRQSIQYLSTRFELLLGFWTLTPDYLFHFINFIFTQLLCLLSMIMHVNFTVVFNCLFVVCLSICVFMIPSFTLQLSATIESRWYFMILSALSIGFTGISLTIRLRQAVFIITSLGGIMLGVGMDFPAAITRYLTRSILSSWSSEMRKASCWGHLSV
jgi:hypothetical protein